MRVIEYRLKSSKKEWIVQIGWDNHVSWFVEGSVEGFYRQYGFYWNRKPPKSIFEKARCFLSNPAQFGKWVNT